MNTSTTPPLHDWLVLHHAFISRNKLAHQLLEHFTNPTTIVNQTPSQLRRLNIDEKYIDALLHPATAVIETELAWASQPGHHIITLDHPRYPSLLKSIHYPPLLLYVNGDVDLLEQPQLAMIGSRNPTHTGKEIAFDFALQLSQQGLLITSGMAQGIDGASHRGALQANQPTLAVLGSGLNVIYPKSHTALAQQITEHGALISEFPLNMAPKRLNFPQRNRIISGLSLATLVVEASLKSGSLITAKFALDQGREVFAIPGSIHNPLSKGCHHLIQQGATLITDIAEIFNEIRVLPLWPEPKKKPKLAKHYNKRYRVPPDQNMTKLLNCFENDSTCVDDLIKRSGFSLQTVTTLLFNLELHGYIRAAPNGYQRVTK